MLLVGLLVGLCGFLGAWVLLFCLFDDGKGGYAGLALFVVIAFSVSLYAIGSYHSQGDPRDEFSGLKRGGVYQLVGQEDVGSQRYALVSEVGEDGSLLPPRLYKVDWEEEKTFTCFTIVRRNGKAYQQIQCANESEER